MDQAKKSKLLRTNGKKGSNQVAVGDYNERLILQLIREHKRLTKAEARLATGLSPNAISVIFRSLEDANLLIREEPIRGRIGQPSTPLTINPEARFYLACKIGRRSLEIAIVNFAGDILASKRKVQPFPTPADSLSFIAKAIPDVLDNAHKSTEDITGLGIAMPFELWSWTAEFGAPPQEMKAWKEFDIKKEIEQRYPWAVQVENDGTAACRAELLFGLHPEKSDWIYLFIGAFIGGGVVLDGAVFSGRRGNAGGFGPMRVPDQHGGNRLIDHASLVVLEKLLIDADEDPFQIYQDKADWHSIQAPLEIWVKRAAENLTHAVVSSLAILDFEHVIIDGPFPDEVKGYIVSQVREQLSRADLQGVENPIVEAGKVGTKARTIGAAATLVDAEFSLNRPIG